MAWKRDEIVSWSIVRKSLESNVRVVSSFSDLAQPFNKQRTKHFCSYQEVINGSHWFDGILSSSAVQTFLDRQLKESDWPDEYRTKGFSLTSLNVDETGSKGGWRIVEVDEPGK